RRTLGNTDPSEESALLVFFLGVATNKNRKRMTTSPAWRPSPVTPAARGLRQEDGKFQAVRSSLARPGESGAAPRPASSTARWTGGGQRPPAAKEYVGEKE
ncbi:hypothetical protein H1C71_032197, partial [Ictidomys tridecemlineatus]